MGHRLGLPQVVDTVTSIRYAGKCKQSTTRSKIMRYTARQVAQQWAQGLPASGSSALTSDGRILKSYNAVIAVRESMPDGSVRVYHTDRRYSNTTSKHQSHMRSAAALAAADLSMYKVSSSELAEIAQKYASMHPYKIVRFRYGGGSRKLPHPPMTLAQAHHHCNDPKTRKEGEWFDGYTEVK